MGQRIDRLQELLDEKCLQCEHLQAELDARGEESKSVRERRLMKEVEALQRKVNEMKNSEIVLKK